MPVASFAHDVVKFGMSESEVWKSLRMHGVVVLAAAEDGYRVSLLKLCNVGVNARARV
jgi:biotin operon repressor